MQGYLSFFINLKGAVESAVFLGGIGIVTIEAQFWETP
jgi:hypothetical protein